MFDWLPGTTRLWNRLANHPRMAGIIPELTHSVPCPGRGSFCPGNVKIDHRAWIYGCSLMSVLYFVLCLYRNLNLFLWKCTKTVATRAAPFGSDMHQIVCWLGLRPRPHLGSLQHSPEPRPLSWFRGWEIPGKEGGSGGGKGGRGWSPRMPKFRVGKPTLKMSYHVSSGMLNSTHSLTVTSK